MLQSRENAAKLSFAKSWVLSLRPLLEHLNVVRSVGAASRLLRASNDTHQSNSSQRKSGNERFSHSYQAAPLKCPK